MPLEYIRGKFGKMTILSYSSPVDSEEIKRDEILCLCKEVTRNSSSLSPTDTPCHRTLRGRFVKKVKIYIRCFSMKLSQTRTGGQNWDY